MAELTLYSYYRSSAAYRVRIALNLKGIAYQLVPVNLLDSEQQQPGYLAVNPQGLIPALALANGQIISQSMAILEWLETTHPEVPLLPIDQLEAAKVRSLSNMVACDIHPLNNLRVLKYLKGPLALSEQQSGEWYRHWIRQGFNTIEQLVTGNPFALGAQPTLADVLLIPQFYNALRFDVDVTNYPVVHKIYDHCNRIAAFEKAHPDNQPDKPAG